MKSLVLSLVVLTILSSAMVSGRRFLKGPLTDSPNPLNPNYTYPEVNRVNTSKAGNFFREHLKSRHSLPWTAKYWLHYC